jgi:hypothetical protein
MYSFHTTHRHMSIFAKEDHWTLLEKEFNRRRKHKQRMRRHFSIYSDRNLFLNKASNLHNERIHIYRKHSHTTIHPETEKVTVMDTHTHMYTDTNNYFILTPTLAGMHKHHGTLTGSQLKNKFCYFAKPQVLPSMLSTCVFTFNITCITKVTNFISPLKIGFISCFVKAVI